MENSDGGSPNTRTSPGRHPNVTPTSPRHGGSYHQVPAYTPGTSSKPAKLAPNSPYDVRSLTGQARATPSKKPKNLGKKRVTHGRLRGWKQKNTVCPWRPGRRGRAQSLTVRGKSPQRTPLVGSCLPNQGVSSKQGAPLPRRASTEQTVSSPGQLDSARASASRVAKGRP